VRRIDGIGSWREPKEMSAAPSPKDSLELVEAQENYKAVFTSGAEATPAQKNCSPEGY